MDEREWDEYMREKLERAEAEAPFSRLEYLDRQGQPLSRHEFQRLLEDWDYFNVRETRGNRRLVRTVWLGLVQRRTPGGLPLYFATMLVDHQGIAANAVELAASENEALIDHQEFVLRHLG